MKPNYPANPKNSTTAIFGYQNAYDTKWLTQLCKLLNGYNRPFPNKKAQGLSP